MLEFEHTAKEAGSTRALVNFVGKMADMIRREIIHAVDEAALSGTQTAEMREGISLNSIKALEKVQEEMKFLLWCAINNMDFPEQLREGNVTLREYSLFKEWLLHHAERKKLEKAPSLGIPMYATSKTSQGQNSVTTNPGAMDDEEIKLLYGEFCRLPIKDRQAVCWFMKKKM